MGPKPGVPTPNQLPNSDIEQAAGLWRPVETELPFQPVEQAKADALRVRDSVLIAVVFQPAQLRYRLPLFGDGFKNHR